jgi:hypothetical protein
MSCRGTLVFPSDLLEGIEMPEAATAPVPRGMACPLCDARTHVEVDDGLRCRHCSCVFSKVDGTVQYRQTRTMTLDELMPLVSSVGTDPVAQFAVAVLLGRVKRQALDHSVGVHVAAALTGVERWGAAAPTDIPFPVVTSALLLPRLLLPALEWRVPPSPRGAKGAWTEDPNEMTNANPGAMAAANVVGVGLAMTTGFGFTVRSADRRPILQFMLVLTPNGSASTRIAVETESEASMMAALADAVTRRDRAQVVRNELYRRRQSVRTSAARVALIGDSGVDFRRVGARALEAHAEGLGVPPFDTSALAIDQTPIWLT